MRNPGDKRVPASLIQSIQRQFRVLDRWTISYAEEEQQDHRRGTYYYNGQCTRNRRRRIAAIYPCPKGVTLRDYVFHEMLHIALTAVGRSRKREESLVRDLCKLLPCQQR